jgi:homoserine kinase type II
MAVYTQVSAEELAQFLSSFDLGDLASVKGIAEGVENSNFLVETTQGRFILTLYEKRVDPSDLPFFLGLMEHLADAGLPVPRPIHNRSGAVLHRVAGRPACLIQFLTGLSVTTPTPALCRAVGAALGALHQAGAGFVLARPNSMGPAAWAILADRIGAGADTIQAGLSDHLRRALNATTAHWPRTLRQGAIHADLFPDNVLTIADQVTGLIDFYFAATDLLAYDLAVTLNAWAFSPDGRDYFPARAAALVEGYRNTAMLDAEDLAALPVLCQGAALRFLLTRSYDWLNTPADAVVTKKDPIAFLRRLMFYERASPAECIGFAAA